MTHFTGIDDFDAQLSAFMNTLATNIGTAAETALDDAKETLRQKILSEVESDDVYKPKVYKRRSEKTGRGTPLSDMKAYARIIKAAGGNVNGRLQVTSRLYYNPQGGHTVQRWHTADYDDLIGRIEKKSPAYTWGRDKVPARPFWQHFIDEMVDQKELEKAFVWAMSGSEPTIKVDGNLVEDTYDREY